MIHTPTNGRSDAVDSPRSPFGVHASDTRDVVVVTATGDVDARTAPQLDDAIIGALGMSTAAVIVDLSDVEFLASAGMAVLVAGNRTAGPGKQFCVVADGPFTDRPMRMVGLDRELRIHSTLAAALDSVR